MKNGDLPSNLRACSKMLSGYDIAKVVMHDAASEIEALQKQLDEFKDVILEQKEAYELQKVALELKSEVIDELKASMPDIKADAVSEFLSNVRYGFEGELTLDRLDEYANQLEGNE